jgi:DNA-directed RNA polymerase subunit RPC12/RpoP
MNTRIYPQNVFLEQVEKLKNRDKIYCPNCYSLVIDTFMSYSKYDLQSKVRNVKKCISCGKVHKSDSILTLIDVRNKKIDEVLK